MNVRMPALEAAQAELDGLLTEARVGDSFDIKRIKSFDGTPTETMAHIKALSARVRELRTLGEAAASGAGAMSGDGNRPHGGFTGTTSTSIADNSRDWANSTAELFSKAAARYGVKALTSGSVDAPGMVRTGIFTMPSNPGRLLDLIINRQSIPGNEFEFLRQTTRTDNAAAVVDNATKPTSVYTVTSVQDRARVYAHLSEAVPLRLFADHKDLRPFLESEMSRGVLDALEDDIINGATGGENVVGILETSGIATQAYDTLGFAQTLRKAVTAMQVAHEAPTAWAINPNDAEVLDLLLTGEGAYVGASANGGFGYLNVFGNIPRLVTTSVPAGTAILADWSACHLYVRQGTTIDVDASGVLFDKNQAKFRVEGRFGFAVNRPAAFMAVDLTE
ncbi:phage major capsid protein [Streptomyces microflavus]|uniref:phage major capsid protein n=1 Tax=Streptomyces microflavus TaxID=1919 RepID=UPI0036B3A146